MKKFLAMLAIAGFAVNVMAVEDPYLSATETYNATDKITQTSKITWLTVDDVPDTCKKMAETLGAKASFVNPRACSFYTKEACTIITKKTPKLGSLEHEVRHCFQGNWH